MAVAVGLAYPPMLTIQTATTLSSLAGPEVFRASLYLRQARPIPPYTAAWAAAVAATKPTSPAKTAQRVANLAAAVVVVAELTTGLTEDLAAMAALAW
jgi:hypothetical protein